MIVKSYKYQYIVITKQISNIMKKFLICAALLALALGADAKTKKTTFTVDGACGMCKTRIEKAANAVPGVTSAKWNVKTKELILIFDDQKTDEKKVQKAIADVGHDTPNYKATDEVYNNLHSCCKYRK